MRLLFAAAVLSGVTAVCAQSLEELNNDGRNTDGGLYWNVAREALKNVPQGGSVWTFALMPD